MERICMRCLEPFRGSIKKHNEVCSNGMGELGPISDAIRELAKEKRES